MYFFRYNTIEVNDMSKNICRFITNWGNESEINIINFVHETKTQSASVKKYETTYKIHIVTDGTGEICFENKLYTLEKGDVFFTFPAMDYSLQSGNNFEYMYISFIGLRTNRLMDELNISKRNFLFKNMQNLFPIWKESIIDSKAVLSLRCEGILLYSFSVLSEQAETKNVKNENLTSKIKKYVEENFSQKDMSLEKISSVFSYNKKYISTIFKNELHIGISQYIATLRIQYACTLMEQGFSCVSDIAYLCGFSDSFYFSKVFKTKMGISPKEHINSLKGENSTCQ